jgi:hypothetical protein
MGKEYKIINTPFLLQSTFGGPDVSPTATATSSTTPTIGSISDDPALIINPTKKGATFYSTSPIAKQLKSKGIKNGQLSLTDATQLVFIGETKHANKRYINPTTNKPEYMLHPAAAKAWFKWRDEMNSNNIKFRVSSGYRNYSHQKGLGSGSTVASAGSSPHGFGGALDFGNLYGIVSGKGTPSASLNGRKNKKWVEIAKAGANYGWYNPWRLSDNYGLDEIWHFEYWGPV